MTKLGEVYLCEYCGNVVRIEQAGQGTLVCCGVEMHKQDRWFPEAVPAVPTNPMAKTPDMRKK